MTMKKDRLWILLAGIVVVISAFLLLNFRLAVNSNQTQKLTFTTDMGENMPAAMQRKDRINLVLVGEGPLVNALQKTLVEKLGEAGMGEIEVMGELEPVSQNPVLVVKVIKPGPIWTPLFAMSRFSIHAGYASNGDSTFMEAIEKTHTSVGKKDVANMYAEYDLNDLSFGLISRPGYYRLLADYLSQEIVAALKDLYKV
jgi:hypothetical protein